MRSRWLGWLQCAGLAVLLGSGTLRAQDTSYDAEARALFEEGRTAFDAERYEDALQHFQGAYRRSQRPQLLFNVAVAADRAGRVVDAIGAYEKFLESVPDDTQRPWIEARLVELRHLPTGGVAPTTPNPFAEVTTTTTTATAAVETPALETPAFLTPTTPVAQPTATTQPPTERAASATASTEELVVSPRSRVPGALLLGGGAIAAVGGVVAIITAHSLAKGVRDTNATTWAEVEDDAQRAPRREKLGFVLLGVGVVAIGAGLVQLVLPSERIEHRERTRVRLGPTGVVVEGAF